MVVYIEYAIAENCLLDGLLLFLAVKCARGKTGPFRFLLATAAGGAEAVLFPLLTLPVWAAYLIKIAGGLLLPLIAVKKGTWKTHVIACLFFFLATFALGGLLTAAYSFFGVEYAEGTGYLVERAPVALVLALAGIFVCLCVFFARWLYRYRRVQSSVFSCKVEANGKIVDWRGFADSGNLLTFRGEPVCLISAVAALALFGGKGAVGRMRVGTVNGSRESPVFCCDRLTVHTEKGERRFEKVYFTVGEVGSKEYCMILNTAFVEGEHESAHGIEGMVAKDKGGRERRPLSLRK